MSVLTSGMSSFLVMMLVSNPAEGARMCSTRNPS